MENILSQWVVWQFSEMPKNILNAGKNFLRFGLNYFSIPFLLKTIISPWHKYRWAYPKGLDIAKTFEVLVSNAFSRLLGFICRIFLIIFGIVSEVFIFFGLGVFLLLWLTLPILLIFGLYYGFRILL